MNRAKNAIKHPLWILTFFISIFIGSIKAQAKVAEPYFEVKNADLRFLFDKRDGTLYGIEDLAAGSGIMRLGEQQSLWKVLFVKDEREYHWNIEGAETFSYSLKDGAMAVLKWQGFRTLSNDSLQVIVTINMERITPFSEWHISINGLQGEKIKEVVFPTIEGIEDKDYDKLAVPTWMGQLMNIGGNKGKKKEYQWSYPGGLSMQFMAAYDSAHKEKGFYFATDDTLGYSKSFSFSSQHAGWGYGIVNYPDYDSTLNQYQVPYNAIIGMFKGDWITAADIYRRWAVKQKWSRDSRFHDNQTAEWLRNTGLWVWNRGRSDNVLVPAEKLKADFNIPVSVFWHWWHGASYDDGFPEYFPPKEGNESFGKAISKARAQGINAMVYMNSFQWGTNTESFVRENAIRFAVKDIYGKSMPHVYNIFTGHSLTPMCIATNFWQGKYASLAHKAVSEFDLSGVYMDQASLNLKCYDPAHGHTIGGGNYWINGFGQLTQKIRGDRSFGNERVLTGEGSGENWIPYLDAFLTLPVSRERYAGVDDIEVIPLFQAVYHQYAITFGNYSSLVSPPYDELWPVEDKPEKTESLLEEKYNTQFRMEQARSFVWGMQPTIANFHDFLLEDRKKEMRFIEDLAKTRLNALKFLRDGEFLRAPQMNIPEKEIPISRLSIYAGQKDRVRSFKKKIPMVYTSAWKSADGSVGIAISNIQDKSYPISFNIISEDYNLPSSGQVYVINDTGKTELGKYHGKNIKIEYQLSPDKSCVIEIVPRKDIN